MVSCIENLSLQLYTCASPQRECPPIAFCQFSVVGYLFAFPASLDILNSYPPVVTKRSASRCASLTAFLTDAAIPESSLNALT